MINKKNILPSSEEFYAVAGLICADTGRSPEELLFFDIETTGLSADTSYLYLIGCMYAEGGRIIHEQFFSEGIDEEALLISEFTVLSERHPLTVHFNGQTFDIPYINRKRALLHLAGPDFDSGYDIFRLLRPFKGFFGLSSMSQKSLEQFCGLNRRDKYDGGELIEFYNHYLAIKRLEQLRAGQNNSFYRADISSGLTQAGPRRSEELLEALLLHNYEDVLGMLTVAGLLTFSLLVKGHYLIEDKAVPSPESTPSEAAISPVPPKAFLIRLKAEYTLPKVLINSCRTIKCLNGDIIEICFSDSDSVEISVPVTTTELKLFYPDYKNYRYLPAEDCAIHHSLADFLDSSLRVKCTAANCYSRHTLEFLPLPGRLSKSDNMGFMLFRYDIHDKMGYVSLNEIESDKTLTEEYVKIIFENI